MKKILLFTLLFCGTTYAQLSIDNVTQNPDGAFVGTKVEYTPTELAKTFLVKSNSSTAQQTVFPENIVYNKSLPNQGRAIIYNDQAGKWETGADSGNLGLGKNVYGLLLSTGKTEVAFGPNNTGLATDVTMTPIPAIEDDPDLYILSNGYTVRNVSVLEFDFVAVGNTVSFDYVFLSEEYPEYSFSAFNDAFGFFLSGPSINGSFSNNAVNLALLPTSESQNFDVTINNVNQQTNENYYVSNGNGTTPLVNTYSQYDGFTKLLTAQYENLETGETYHLKIAIGNVGDNTYDSGVFLKSPIANFNKVLSKKSFLDKNIQLYPNPANNKIQIDLNNAGENLESIVFYDLIGKRVMSLSNLKSNQSNIDVSALAKGMYLVEITTLSNLKITKKLMIED